MKLKVKHTYNPNFSTAPVIGSDVTFSLLTQVKETDYVGNKIYENGKLKRILVDGGYWEDGKYYFFQNDHLGNVRMVLDQDAGIIQRKYYYPFGAGYPEGARDNAKQPYKYNGKELDQMHRLDWYDYSARHYDLALGRFTTVDPLAEKYYSISPYAYVMNNPLKYIDPDGRKIRIANNLAGAMENVAKIAATTFGGQIMSRLISRNETYTMNSVFWSDDSAYKALENGDGLISYVGNPMSRTNGGWLKSFIAMGHETMHGYDHSYNAFNYKNAGASGEYTEPRAVSFENYLREVYGDTNFRNKYANIDGNFNQFTTNGNEKISNFSTIGNNKDKTSYGFSYVKRVNEKEVNRFGYQTGKTITSEKTYYMTVSVDKNKNLTYKIYNNEKEYKAATGNW
ncbi:RHS repeat-associated protein [Dysgonomonas sp. PFB1-18]|uniref:RHS repeat-associated core domain-containing protein n=1 Tax=unclassified Dysgonomonas TaxID=2630389 RepID=UPI0024731E20|nr:MULTISPECIES: RHS repeat-associated core domain-containing protein [unclassified Dysgonomonas]MDH6310682.1 RHS repeat-associated protein [Dysgonomonas sp. PF1-14]MDH6340533.1 RHS repeat-associated protein [Dysgonomonas sp. PF1-16]MDH6382211.1 RHS repeat-associated protein [Dysgonomonas sp. PFB1-18]MDH6399554.1 RHS repeat-associated protein [Dysgonomonas sp. PF1-23]